MQIVRRTPSSVQSSTCFIMRQTQVVIDLQRGMKELILQVLFGIWEAFNFLSDLCAKKKKSLLTLLWCMELNHLPNFKFNPLLLHQYFSPCVSSYSLWLSEKSTFLWNKHYTNILPVVKAAGILYLD